MPFTSENEDEHYTVHVETEELELVDGRLVFKATGLKVNQTVETENEGFVPTAVEIRKRLFNFYPVTLIHTYPHDRVSL